MTEAELQGAVVDMARTFGWTVAHFRPAQTSKGWRTPVGYDGQGFPDLLMARDRVVFVELKGDNGRVSEHQKKWGAKLAAAGAEYHLWTPADWKAGNVDRVLR